MFNFSYVDSCLGRYIPWKVKTRNMGMNFKKHPLHDIFLLYRGVDLSVILSQLATYFHLFWFKEFYDVHYIKLL